MEGSTKRCEDLTGRRFGLLVAKEMAPKTGPGYAEWICECDCGGKMTVSSKRLKRGTVTNCGCIPKKTAGNGSIAEDLSGQTFGALRVVNRVPNRNGRTCWSCRCACGKLHSATAHDLKSGQIVSCGCGIGKKRYYKDLRGMVFGQLRPVRPLEERDAKGSVLWECLCECGKTTKVAEDRLMSLNKQSCGCKKDKWQKEIYKTLHRVNGTTIEMLQEKKARSDSATQAVGVCRRSENRYRTVINLCGERYYLGTYPTLEEAVQVRKRGEQMLFEPVREAFERWNAYAADHPEWAEAHPFKFQVVELHPLDYKVLFDALPEDAEVSQSTGSSKGDTEKKKNGTLRQDGEGLEEKSHTA